MATIMIISGLYSIREWKVHEKNTTAATCLAVVAPCPCCFGSIIVSILFLTPTVGVGTFVLSQYVALALMIIILTTYLASNLIVKVIKKPYPIILGNFMLFLGLYFLASSLILPNIMSILGQNMGKITIESVPSVIIISVIFIFMVIIGVFISKKSSMLNN